MGAEIIPFISAVGSLLGGGGSLFQAFGGGGQRAAEPPQPAPVAGPPGPPPDQTSFSRPAGMDAPAFLGMNSQMTPIQQRASIATRAVSGDESAFRDPATQEYYKNLVLRDVVGDGGTVRPGASILPSEKQYLSSVMGRQPNTDTPESFLSALLRS